MDIQELVSSDFPSQLREIHLPPKKLWLRGTLPLEGTKMLTVVGSRALSAYGRQACESLIAGLAGHPVSIVSGLALGADACAHRAAMRAGLHTIAVPGSGLGDAALYPRTNRRLANDILASGGALLSEHEPDHRAAPWDFPMRNRIMVGLSHAVLIIEAGKKSGTLITARMAGEFNRELLCVPHRIGDPHGHGANVFIRIGATLVSEPEHILQALGIEPGRSEHPEQLRLSLSSSERIIYDALIEPVARDDLLRTCGLPAHEALSVLGIMELNGVVKEEFGYWKRA